MLQVIRPYVKNYWGKTRKSVRADGEIIYTPRRKLTPAEKARVTKQYEALTGERFDRDTGHLNRVADDGSRRGRPVKEPGYKGSYKRGLLQGGDGAEAPDTPEVRELLRRKGRPVENARGLKFKRLPFPGFRRNEIRAGKNGAVEDRTDERTRTYFPYSPYQIVIERDEGDEGDEGEDDDEEYHKALEKIIEEITPMLDSIGALQKDGETFKAKYHATIAVGGGEEGGGKQYDSVEDLAERFIELIEEWKRKYGKASSPVASKEEKPVEWIHGFYVTKIHAQKRRPRARPRAASTPKASAARARRKRAPSRHRRR